MAVLLLLGPGTGLGQVLQYQGDSGQGSSTLEGFSSWAREELGTCHHREEMLVRASPRKMSTSSLAVCGTDDQCSAHSAQLQKLAKLKTAQATTTIFLLNGEPPRSVPEYEIFQGRRIKTKGSSATGHMYYILGL